MMAEISGYLYSPKLSGDHWNEMINENNDMRELLLTPISPDDVDSQFKGDTVNNEYEISESEMTDLTRILAPKAADLDKNCVSIFTDDDLVEILGEQILNVYEREEIEDFEISEDLKVSEDLEIFSDQQPPNAESSDSSLSPFRFENDEAESTVMVTDCGLGILTRKLDSIDKLVRLKFTADSRSFDSSTVWISCGLGKNPGERTQNSRMKEMSSKGTPCGRCYETHSGSLFCVKSENGARWHQNSSSFVVVWDKNAETFDVSIGFFEFSNKKKINHLDLVFSWMSGDRRREQTFFIRVVASVKRDFKLFAQKLHQCLRYQKELKKVKRAASVNKMKEKRKKGKRLLEVCEDRSGQDDLIIVRNKEQLEELKEYIFKNNLGNYITCPTPTSAGGRNLTDVNE